MCFLGFIAFHIFNSIFIQKFIVEDYEALGITILCLICTITISLFIFYFMSSEYKKLKSFGTNYFKNFWNCIDFLTYICSLITNVILAIMALKVFYINHNIIYDINVTLYNIFRYFNFLAIFFLCIKALSYARAKLCFILYFYFYIANMWV